MLKLLSILTLQMMNIFQTAEPGDNNYSNTHTSKLRWGYLNFELFIISFLRFTSFLFKGSCSSKSILFIYSYFLQRKILYNHFFFLFKTMFSGIMLTHIFPHCDFFFPPKCQMSGNLLFVCVHYSVHNNNNNNLELQ